jgi:hypothetical protein
MINFICEFYFMRIILFVIFCYFANKILKKYLNIDLFNILSVGVRNIVKILGRFKNESK